MKKITKRLLALILGATMVFGCAFSSYAADENDVQTLSSTEVEDADETETISELSYGQDADDADTIQEVEEEPVVIEAPEADIDETFIDASEDTIGDSNNDSGYAEIDTENNSENIITTETSDNENQYVEEDNTNDFYYNSENVENYLQTDSQTEDIMENIYDDTPTPDDAEDTDDDSGDSLSEDGLSNDNADIETAADWENTLLEELTGVWADDLITVAKSQIGYAESTENYRVNETGQHKGYTRYGAWYGDPYGDWCAMFVSFCLYYAEIPTSAFPENSSCLAWVDELSELGMYEEAKDYIPVAGDLIFFDNSDSNNKPIDHVGIVSNVIEDGDTITIETIEGNSSNAVRERSYDSNNSRIVGYGILPENPDTIEEENKADETDEYEIKTYNTTSTTEYDLSLTTNKDSYEVGETVTYTFTINYKTGGNKPYGWCYLPSGITYNGMISATHNENPYTYYHSPINNGFEIEDMSETVSAGDVFEFVFSGTIDGKGDYTTTAYMDGGTSVGVSFTATEAEGSIVDTILDSSDPLTQGGASDSYYKDGHYYHIDVRIDSDFDYIYNDGVFTIVTDTGINVTKTWQGGVPDGVTSVTYYVYRDNGDGTSDKLYYDGDGFLTTEPTREESSGRTTTTVNNTPVSITAKQSDGWSATLDLEAGNYVLVEEEVDGYTSDITYVTVDTSTGEQLNGSYYTYNGNIEVADVNWVMYEMNDNDNADYHYYDDGAFAGYEYGYLNGSYYSAPSSSQQQTTGDWEFFLDDGNSNGGRGIKFFTNESTIWVNIDYTVYYVNENGTEVSQTFTDQTFEFTPEEWMADNLCTEKDATNTMRGVDLLIEGQRLMEAVTAQESSSTITASATNVKDGDDSLFLTGTKSWISADGTYEQTHDNENEVELLLYRSVNGSDEERLMENVDYVVTWNNNTYTIWGGHSGTAGSYEGLPKTDENGNEYTYRVDEAPVDGYESVITPILRDDGFYDNDITNTASEEKTYAFSIRKTDENGNSLDGAVFTLSDNSGKELYFVNENGAYALSKSSVAPASIYIRAGNTAITGLSSGEYILTEMIAPSGYYITEETHTIVIDDDGLVSMDGETLYANIATIKNKTQGTPTPTKYSDHATDFNGDTVEYTVDINSIQGVHDLVLHDFLDDELQLKKSRDEYAVTVTLYSTEEDKENGENGTVLTYGENYNVICVDECTYEPDDECTFEIDFSKSAELFDTLDENNVLHIVYDCDINTEGDAYDDDYTHLENIAHTTYSLRRSEDVEADVDIYGFEIDKYTLADGAETPVTGAVFQLTDESGIPAYFLQEDDIYLFEGWGVASGDYTNDIITDGTIKIEGFAGDVSNAYTLIEVETPYGYVMQTDPLTITINADGEVFFDGQPASDGHTVKVFNNPLISISGTKTWEDENDNDGLRPDTITVHLYANNSEIDTVSVGKDTNWEYEFTDLPEYQINTNGTITKITYTVTETTPSGYVANINGYDIMNVHNPEKINISGQKTWDDNNDSDGLRPTDITVRLYANGTEVASQIVNEDTDWAYEFTDLYKYENGKEITYEIKEDAVDGYTTEYADYNITNIYEPELISVSGEKIWDDTDSADRPDNIIVRLFADDKEIDSQIVSEDTDWAWCFENLNKYRDHGIEIVYTVSEDVPDGYFATYDGDAITNHMEPEISKYVSDPQLGESTDDRLKQDEADNGDTLEYLIVAEHVGNTQNFVIHEYMDEQLDVDSVDIKSVTLFENAEADGRNIDYTVSDGPCSAECGLDDCTFEIHIADGELANLTAQAYIEVVLDVQVNESEFNEDLSDEIDNFVGLSFNASQWADPDETETFSYGFDVTKTAYTEETKLMDAEFILSDGETYALFEQTDDAYIISGWTDEKEDATVLVTDENGHITVKGLHSGVFNLIETTAPDGYRIIDETTEINVTDDALSVNIENMPLISVSGTKTWDDANDQDGKRPDSITVHLYADGEEVKEMEVSEDTDWNYEFTGLDKYSDDHEIVYTVAETDVEEYSSEVNGYDITNTHTPGKTALNVQKIWDDGDDRDGIRPEVVTVVLIQNGEATDSTAVLSKENDWMATFDDLDEYENGTKIEYSVSEVEEDGYKSAVTVDEETMTAFVTNTHEPELKSVSGIKLWEDNEDQDGIRPENVTIRLMANGTEIDSTVASKDTNWSYEFNDLYKYDSGTEIEYTVSEDEVDGYTADYDGYTITNTHAIETTDIEVQKLWKGDSTDVRPDTVKVILIKNGEQTDAVLSLDGENDWFGTFGRCDKYENGELIEYTVEEVSVLGYESSVEGDMDDGFTITNTWVSESSKGDDTTTTKGQTSKASTGNSGTKNNGNTGNSGNTNNGSNKNSGSSKTSSSGNAKTADTIFPIVYSILICATIVVVYVAFRRRRTD